MAGPSTTTAPEAPRVRRRILLKRGAAAAAGIAAGAALSPPGERARAAPALPAAIRDQKLGEHQIVRMQRDLHRALAKPVERRKWMMIIDTRRCIGCDACTVACIAENGLPPGVQYRTVVKAEKGTFPNVEAYFKPTGCMQCDKPPCLPAANAVSPGAVEKRPDGVVALNYEKFNRRAYQAASRVCPYAALSFDDGKYWTQGTPALQAYETRPRMEYGRSWTRLNGALPIGAGRKCHFCLQRVEAGMLPACVSTCIGGAMYFGDETDPDGLISELRKTTKTWRVNEEKGTEPRILYVGAASRKTMPVSTPESCIACHDENK